MLAIGLLLAAAAFLPTGVGLAPLLTRNPAAGWVTAAPTAAAATRLYSGARSLITAASVEPGAGQHCSTWPVARPHLRLLGRQSQARRAGFLIAQPSPPTQLTERPPRSFPACPGLVAPLAEYLQSSWLRLVRLQKGTSQHSH